LIAEKRTTHYSNAGHQSLPTLQTALNVKTSVLFKMARRNLSRENAEDTERKKTGKDRGTCFKNCDDIFSMNSVIGTAKFYSGLSGFG